MSAKKINTEAVVDVVTTKAAEVANAVEAAVEAVVEAAPKKAAKKAAAPKKTAAKKTTKKAEPKKVAKKAAAKKTVVTMTVEMGGKSLEVSEIQAAVEAAVAEKGLTAAELKIYVNTAEQAAYYTVNGEGSAEYRVEL